MLQAWWVGEGFFADVWKVCFNSSNCTEIGDNYASECEADGAGWMKKRMLRRKASLLSGSSSSPSPSILGGAWQDSGSRRQEGCGEGRGSRGLQSLLRCAHPSLFLGQVELPFSYLLSSSPHLESSPPSHLPKPPLYIAQRLSLTFVSLACTLRAFRAGCFVSCVVLPWGRSSECPEHQYPQL